MIFSIHGWSTDIIKLSQSLLVMVDSKFILALKDKRIAKVRVRSPLSWFVTKFFGNWKSLNSEHRHLLELLQTYRHVVWFYITVYCMSQLHAVITNEPEWSSKDVMQNALIFDTLTSIFRNNSNEFEIPF